MAHESCTWHSCIVLMTTSGYSDSHWAFQFSWATTARVHVNCANDATLSKQFWARPHPLPNSP